MLTPQELELLTAHVDGELTAAQRRQVSSLLEHSAEARDMLTWLEQDAQRLRGLPRRPAPFDFSAGVLDAIVKLDRRPAPRPRVVLPPAVHKFPRWVGYATAAAVLLAVGVGSFVYNWKSQDAGEGNGNAVARNNGDEEKNTRRGADKDTYVKVGPEDEGKTKNGSPLVKVEGKDKSGTTTQSDKGTKPINTAPPIEGSALLTSGGGTSPKLERVELDLPSVARLHDLDRGEAAKVLADRLAKLKGARVELTAKDAVRAFEPLRAAMEAKKVRLHIDPATQARRKKTLSKTDFIVYAENLTPADLIDVLRQVGVADRAGEMRFDGAVVVREISFERKDLRWDSKDLTDLLGIDPRVTKPATAKRKAGVDIRRDLADQTAFDVVAALDGRGVPRPGAEVALHAYVSHLPSPKSRGTVELKRFLELRQPARPGTLAVLLVLRNVG
jgi:hypothetical protein